jgi:hypothetical protein
MESPFLRFTSWVKSQRPHGAGHSRRKEAELEAVPLTQNRLQALFLCLAGPWAQKRIPIFGGRVLLLGASD